MKFALIALLFLVGCSGFFLNGHLGEFSYTRKSSQVIQSQFIPVYIDKQYGNADQTSIDNALAQWNYALNGYAELRVVDTQFDMQPDILQRALNRNAMLILKIQSDNPMIPSTDAGYWTLGFVNRVGGRWVYLVRDRIQNQDVTYLMLHEIGHALGAVHQDNGLMFKHYNMIEFQCIDRETVLQVAAYNHWPGDRMNYCVVGGLQKSQNGGNVFVDSVGP